MINSSTDVTKRQGFFAALLFPQYRYLWFSTVSVAMSMAIEPVVIGWLVLELTDSAALVGLVSACRFAGMGLAPFLGALADRFDRRRFLIIERLAITAYALLFAVLYFASLLELWHIFVLTLLGGVFRSADFTIRYAMTPNTIEGRALTSAVSLLVAGMGITSFFGPLIGGYLYGPAGVGVTFIIMAGFYLLGAVVLFPMHPRTAERLISHESAWKSMLSGFHYILQDRVMLALMIMAAIANLFAFPIVFGVLPVFAKDILHVGAEGFGWLTAAEGLGALIGALVTSGLERFRRKGWLLVSMMVVWALLLGSLAGAPVFYLSLAFMVSAGIARGIAMALIQVLLLVLGTEETRGRVSGVRMFAVVMLPVGNIISGFGADLWNVLVVIGFNAAFCIVTTALTAIWIPELRRRA